MRIPKAAWGLVKEVARHLLRRPVVGLVALATDPQGMLDGVHEFLLDASPLPFTGGCGSPTNPVAVK